MDFSEKWDESNEVKTLQNSTMSNVNTSKKKYGFVALVFLCILALILLQNGWKPGHKQFCNCDTNCDTSNTSNKMLSKYWFQAFLK